MNLEKTSAATAAVASCPTDSLTLEYRPPRHLLLTAAAAAGEEAEAAAADEGLVPEASVVELQTAAAACLSHVLLLRCCCCCCRCVVVAVLELQASTAGRCICLRSSRRRSAESPAICSDVFHGE